ncbi:hypothetical protein [Massilia sp. S19_KUP03_FR1]|uniref:hypothetical protein n=1 Tax=Massilia sp. S19_KUP03_FR1 TaxID=3025503 RepID=UPI002FCDA414
MNAHHDNAAGTSARSAASVIIISALASIAAVALDTAAQGRDPLSILQSMVNIRASHRINHVVAMACIGALTFGFTVLSQRLGLRRAPVLVGLIAYSAGSMLMFVATIIDGFISTDTAALFVTKSPEAVRTGYWLIQALAGVALTDIALVAWVCQSLAAVAWSLALLRDPGLARRIGMVGAVTGALPGVAIVVAGANLTQALVVGVLLLQGVWYLGAAACLLVGAKGARMTAPETMPRLEEALLQRTASGPGSVKM